ncbi:hypothetical protein MRX96_048145 [Rhipicephalus microplus]
MSTTCTDDTSEETTKTSSRMNRMKAENSDGEDGDSSLLQMMGLSESELHQLSGLSDESPRAPANSLESLDGRAGRSKAQDQCLPALVRDERAITDSSSKEAKPRWPSFGAAVASLACVILMIIAFLAAVAYGIFLFHLDRIPAPERNMRAHRSSNDTGADRG